MNDQCIKPYMNARRTSTTQSSIDGRTLCTPADLHKQQNGEPKKLGSPNSGLVARTGFEPVISALRGRRPEPLDERAVM